MPRTERKTSARIPDDTVRAAFERAKASGLDVALYQRFRTHDPANIPTRDRKHFLEWCELLEAYAACRAVDREAAEKFFIDRKEWYGSGQYELQDFKADWLRDWINAFREKLPRIEAARAERLEHERAEAERRAKEEPKRREKEQAAEAERLANRTPQEELTEERDAAMRRSKFYIMPRKFVGLGAGNLEWIIDGIIPDKGYCILYGDPGTYKTYLALDMGLSIAAGLETWISGAAINASYPVLYIATEGAASLENRIETWEAAKNGGIPVDDFHVLPDTPKIGTGDFERLASEAKRLSDYFDFVIIDKLKDVLTEEHNEDTAKTATAIKDELDTLRNALQCPVLLIHHTTKAGDQERGSGGIRSDADAMFLTKAARGKVSFKATKLRDRPAWKKALQFVPKQIEGMANIALVSHDPNEETTATESDIDRTVMAALEPGEYTLNNAAKLVAPGSKFSENTWRQRKLKQSRFYRHGKLIVTEESD